MPGRRSFLGLLIGSPLIAKEASEQLTSANTTGLVASEGFEPVDEPQCDRPFGLSGVKNGFEKMDEIRKRIDEQEFQHELRLPHHIEGRKSWSTAFKHSVYQSERRKIRALWAEFHSVHECQNPIDAALKVSRLAKKLGMTA